MQNVEVLSIEKCADEFCEGYFVILQLASDAGKDVQVSVFVDEKCCENQPDDNLSQAARLSFEARVVYAALSAAYAAKNAASVLQ
jgi:hypothetical protein